MLCQMGIVALLMANGETVCFTGLSDVTERQGKRLWFDESLRIFGFTGPFDVTERQGGTVCSTGLSDVTDRQGKRV
jgi:hypothetical protein